MARRDSYGPFELFHKLFEREGFQWVSTPRGRSILGWQGYAYPYVELAAIDDPWGRPDMDLWISAKLILENNRGLAPDLKEATVIRARMTSISDVPDIVNRFTEKAKSFMRKWEYCQAGASVYCTSDQRNHTIVGLVKPKGGYLQPAPVILSGSTCGHTYGELRCPVDHEDD